MKKISLSILSICILCLTGCLNDLDNYDAPDGGIKGRVLDAETGELIPLPVQGSTGVIINMYEQNTEATKSVDFYARYDGSFENSRMFNSEYKIVVNGPFVDTCEGMVTVKGQTSLEMKATPYARIEASASVSGKVVTVQYKVKKTNESFSVSEIYGYWNFAPGVDDGSANQAGKIVLPETEGSFSFDLSESSTYLNNINKIESNGNKIYLRVGSKTNNVINYSQVMTISL